MKKLLVGILVFICSTISMLGQLTPTAPIPVDPDVRIGKLSNGMTYYIRHNEKPKGQADFYILSDVGAIQEEDDQQGLAHFLEHMAFNGTKNLKGKQMIEYLETIGVKFGTNLNAATSWDYTNYLIKDVPVAREAVVDSLLLILHDWAHFIDPQPKEIDSERGVIKEELRTRDNAQWRSTLEMLKALAKGTKYTERNLIGSLEGLESFPHEALTRFYHQWYRPDYQAVFIVGDIDVDAIESKIKALMGDIPAPENSAPKKTEIIVPDNEEPIISIYTDVEMQASTIQYFIKHRAMPKAANGTVGGRMVGLIKNFISTMEDERFSEIAMKPDAPFVGGGMSIGSVGIIPTMESVSFYMQTKEGKLLESFNLLSTEIERLQRFGFTVGEFERAKANILSSRERHYANRNDRTNNGYVQVYQSHFRRNTPIASAADEWKLDSTLINNITLEMVNQVAQQIIIPNNRVVAINSPKKDGLAVPTQQQFADAIKSASTAELEPYEDNVVKEPLIDPSVALKGSAVTAEKEVKEFDATEWTLANGIKVIVKPSTLKADEVLLYAESAGGSAILNDDEAFSGLLLANFLPAMGLSKFSSVDLSKQLSGKRAGIQPWIDRYSNGFSGSASPRDVETMLQLLYLQFTAPRFDEKDFNTTMSQYHAFVENMRSNPDYIAQERVVKNIYNNNPRVNVLSMESLSKIKFETLSSIHERLYPNGNSFRFTIVGNVDLTTLKPLVEKYIGSLPCENKKLGFVDDKVRPASGKKTDEFRTPMQQPKVGVNYFIWGELPFTMKNRYACTYLQMALDNIYLESIREEAGGTYGVSVGLSLQKKPTPYYQLRIQFDTNEKQVNELRPLILKAIEDIAANGPSAEQMSKAREFLLKNFQNSLEKNNDWLTYINRYYLHGFDYVSDAPETIRSITADDVKALAKKMIKDGNVINTVMLPEAKAEN